MKEIIEYLQEIGGQTVSEISKNTGYSRSYVSTACLVLFNLKLLKRERENRCWIYATQPTTFIGGCDPAIPGGDITVYHELRQHGVGIAGRILEQVQVGDDRRTIKRFDLQHISLLENFPKI